MEETQVIVTVGHYSDETPEQVRQNVHDLLFNGGYMDVQVTLPGK